MIDTIIHHADCPDGFGAAFVLKQKFPEAQLVPAFHGKPIDESLVKGKRVLVVDFSWKREETLRLKDLAKSMFILDHHKSAEKELEGLPFATFDMSRSGIQLAWDFAFPNEPRPWWVDYTADRDLWRWELPDSQVINAFIMTLPHTIEGWSQLREVTFEGARLLGTGARAQIDHYVEKTTAQALPGVLDGKWVKIVNVPYPNISDVLGKLVDDGADVGVGWFVREDLKVQFSLRSEGDLDVSKIAENYGGGGHRNAAGFQLPFDLGMKLVRSMIQEGMALLDTSIPRWVVLEPD